MGFIGILQMPMGDCLVGAHLVCGLVADTECTAVRDYGFPVRLGNPAWALLCPVWLWDMAGVVWLHCSCGLSAEQIGLPAR